MKRRMGKTGEEKSDATQLQRTGQQPPYNLVEMAIDPQTSNPVARVWIPSTNIHISVDITPALQGLSKNARRRAIIYGKTLPTEAAARVDDLIQKAVADYMAKHISEVPRHSVSHKQMRRKSRKRMGNTWPERGVFRGGLPYSSRKRH